MFLVLNPFITTSSLHISAVSRCDIVSTCLGILSYHRLLRCVFRTPRFVKSLKFFGTSIASLDPETIQLPAFSILSAMFIGACGPTEKLSLALAPRSNVLRMIVSTCPCILGYVTIVVVGQAYLKGQSQPLLCFCLHPGTQLTGVRLLEIRTKKYLINKRNTRLTVEWFRSRENN